MTDPQTPLPIKEKLAYGLGDAGANLIFQTQISFLLYFYTDVLGIAAATAGQILLVSRVVDAFNDPIVGALADRTRTRWGRYRPWLLWTAAPIAAALIFCYTTPQLSASGKVIWAIVTYNVLMILYAANNIPYCALSGVITSDTYERTSLASWRFLCAMAATLVVNMFTVDLVRYFGAGDKAIGYQWTMGFWGILAIICFLVTFAFTRERVTPDPRQRSSLLRDLADLAGNRPWIALFTLGLLIYVQLALRGGSMLYYFTQYLNREDLFGWFNGIGLAVTMVGVFLGKPLAERFGKRGTFYLCLLLSAVFMGAIALVPPDAIPVLFALQILMQLTFGPTIPLLWAMMADVADYGEWKTGRASTGLMFASIVFGTKLGLGIGAWLNGRLLEHFGYTAIGATPDFAIRGIVLLVSIFPAAALLIGVGVLYFYRLDDPTLRRIERELAQTRLQEGSR